MTAPTDSAILSTPTRSALAPTAGSVVYISGAISSDPNFKEKFDLYEKLVMECGAKRVLNPTILPPGWEYVEYMEHCLLMVRHADTLVMLPCWSQSPGARAEHAYGVSLRRRIIDLSLNEQSPSTGATE